MSGDFSVSGWHPASHPVSRARIEAVAARSMAEPDVVARQHQPAFRQAKPVAFTSEAARRPFVPLVAVCPDGTIEHYTSAEHARKAMGMANKTNICHILDKPEKCCRDRRWYRAGTYQTKGESDGHRCDCAKELPIR